MLNDEQRCIVEANLPLVKYTLNKYLPSTVKCMEYEDMLSIGYEGLCRAAELYVPERGYTFSTYAVKVIVRFVHRSLLSYTRKKRGYGVETISLEGWRSETDENSIDRMIGFEPDFVPHLIDKILLEPVWKMCPTHNELYNSKLPAKKLAKQYGVCAQTLFNRRRKEFDEAKAYLHGIGIDDAV